MLRRRPIVRRLARTAVVAGTAGAVAGGVARHQAGRNPPPEQAAEEAPAADPLPEPAPDPIEQLSKLGELKDKGVLTEEEFAQQKAKVLAEM